MNCAIFRFYAELNDFLPQSRRQTTFKHCFNGGPAVKDTIESLGVPHTEVDLILVDGEPVGFDHLLQDGDRVSVYPRFVTLDLGGIQRLRPEPLRHKRFVLDIHLGKLANYLRMLGVDTLYRNDYADATLAEISRREKRRHLWLLCAQHAPARTTSGSCQPVYIARGGASIQPLHSLQRPAGAR